MSEYKIVEPQFHPGMSEAEIVAELERVMELLRDKDETSIKAPYCDCIIPKNQVYCHVHDATLTCPQDECDLVFPHTFAEMHSAKDCGCYYGNGGDFHICVAHEEMLV